MATFNESIVEWLPGGGGQVLFNPSNIMSFSCVADSFATQELSFGGTVARQLEVEVYTSAGAYSSNIIEVGKQIEWKDVRFEVVEVEITGKYTYKFLAYDDMSKFEDVEMWSWLLSQSSTDVSLYSFYTSVLSQAGDYMSLAGSGHSFQNSSIWINPQYLTDYLRDKLNRVSVTARELLSWIGDVAGVFFQAGETTYVGGDVITYIVYKNPRRVNLVPSGIMPITPGMYMSGTLTKCRVPVQILGVQSRTTSTSSGEEKIVTRPTTYISGSGSLYQIVNNPILYVRQYYASGVETALQALYSGSNSSYVPFTLTCYADSLLNHPSGTVYIGSILDLIGLVVTITDDSPTPQTITTVITSMDYNGVTVALSAKGSANMGQTVTT